MERYNESSDVRQLFRGAVAVRGTAGEAKNESLQPSDAFKRVAAYCRVSTDSKAQETSIETQRAYFEHEIGNHPGWKLVQIYADQGVTGTICKALNRDEIQTVIEKLQGEKPQRSKSREKLTAAEHLLELWKKRLFLKKVDYYWLDDTVDRITFSKENTLTVHWRCGLKTTVPLPVRHHRENPVYAAEVYRKRKVEGTLKPRRRIQKRLEDPNPIPIISMKEGQKK